MTTIDARPCVQSVVCLPRVSGPHQLLTCLGILRDCQRLLVFLLYSIIRLTVCTSMIIPHLSENSGFEQVLDTMY